MAKRAPSFTNLSRLGNSSSSNNLNQLQQQQAGNLVIPELEIDDAMTTNAPVTQGSAWMAPDSWDIRPPGAGEAVATANLGIVVPPEPVPPHALKSTADVLLWTDEMYDDNGIRPGEEGTLKVYYPNGYHSTITCRIATTTKDLLLAAMKKNLVNDWTKYNLVVCRNGLERNMELTESPLLLVWKWLQQVGYCVNTKPDPMEWANHTYLCSFHFREIILSYVSLLSAFSYKNIVLKTFFD